MDPLKFHYEKVVQYDLINKFHYSKLTSFPKLKKISLSFDIKSSNLKDLIVALIALNLITNQKSLLVKSKISSISLSIRKGNPRGCRITLRKKYMNFFLLRLIQNVLGNVKYFEGFLLAPRNGLQTLNFTLSDIFKFAVLEKKFYIFKSLPNLKITIVTTSNNFNEFFFLFRSLNYPLFSTFNTKR